MRSLLRVLGVLAFIFASAWVNAQSSWTSLNGLSSGQKIQVIETNSKKHSGTFVSVSDTAITFREGNGERSVQRTDVRKVKLQNQRRARNVLIGTGVGAGIGAVFGAAVAGNGGFVSRPAGAAAFGLIGAVFGTPIGLVASTHNTVYSAH
jgi:hypothetical protein